MTQRTAEPQDDLLKLADLSPLLLDRLTRPVLQRTLAEILDPTRRSEDLEAGFDNRI